MQRVIQCIELSSNIGINIFTVRTIRISSKNLIMNNIDTAQPNRTSIITNIPVKVNMGAIISHDYIYRKFNT